MTSMPKATIKDWAALAVLMLPVLLVSIDNTVLSFALPQISLEFNTEGTTLLWIIDIYPLVLSGLLVVMGSFSDRFGRRKLLMIGAIGFGIFSVFAAFSPNAQTLVVFRAILGFFGAMLMPATLSLIRNIFLDRNERKLALAIWAAGFAAGAAIGPIVGGLLLEYFHWGSVFLLAVPMLVPMVILLPMLVPESKDPTPGPVDVLSIFLSIATLGPLIYGIKTTASYGGSWEGFISLALSVIFGFLFVKRQFNSTHPMLDLRLFGYRPFTGSVIVNLLAVFSLTGFIYFGSQHLQLVLNLSPLEAGLYLLPGLALMIITGLVIVKISQKLPVNLLVAISLILSSTGYLISAIVGNGASAWALALAFAVLSAGVGSSETLSNDIIVSSVPAEKAGAASAISETAYEVGTVLGTAVLGSILISSYKSHIKLPEVLSPQQELIASETLGGALNVAQELAEPYASELINNAHTAFDSGVVITSSIGFVLMLLSSVFAFVMLKNAK